MSTECLNKWCSQFDGNLHFLDEAFPDGSIAVAAIDGTSMQRHNPGMHYLKRIDRENKVSIPIYLNAIADVINRKFAAIRHHATKCGEVPDAYYLIKQSPREIELAIMDKFYDSEKLHGVRS